MVFEWFARGAEIGVTAFAAIAVFALIGVALLGLFALGVTLMKENDDANEGRH